MQPLHPIALSFTVALSLTGAVRADCSLPPDAARRAGQVVIDMVQRGHAPGAVLDVRCEGKPVLQLAVGQTDREAGTAASANQLFRIYSMTKPITSVAALMLVAQGRLDLDAPLGQVLPEWRHPQVFVSEDQGQLQTRPASREPTLRDLLSHQTGVAYLSPLPHPVLKRYVERGIDSGSGEDIRPTDGSAPVASAEELSQRLASLPLLHEPGAAWTYGNSTDLVGAVVERVSGQRLGAFLQQHLFGPLGMRDTYFQVPDTEQARFTPAYLAPTQSPGHAPFADVNIEALGPSKFLRRDGVDTSSPFRRRRPIDFGGAGLVSTAADYQRFLTFLLQDGQWEGKVLLPAALVRAMRTDQLSPQAHAAMAGKRFGGFGLGLGVITDNAQVGLPAGLAYWGGAASTFAWLQPTERLSVVVMTQVFGGDVGPYQVRLAKALNAPAAQVAAAGH